MATIAISTVPGAVYTAPGMDRFNGYRLSPKDARELAQALMAGASIAQATQGASGA